MDVGFGIMVFVFGGCGEGLKGGGGGFEARIGEHAGVWGVGRHGCRLLDVYVCFLGISELK